MKVTHALLIGTEDVENPQADRVTQGSEQPCPRFDVP
jgi:hypothetical protein